MGLTPLRHFLSREAREMSLEARGYAGFAPGAYISILEARPAGEGARFEISFPAGKFLFV